jgi:hypothetical protein
LNISFRFNNGMDSPKTEADFIKSRREVVFILVVF